MGDKGYAHKAWRKLGKLGASGNNPRTGHDTRPNDGFESASAGTLHVAFLGTTQLRVMSTGYDCIPAEDDCFFRLSSIPLHVRFVQHTYILMYVRSSTRAVSYVSLPSRFHSGEAEITRLQIEHLLTL